MSMPEGIDPIQWASAACAMVAVYIIVEIEKALVDPIMMPIIRPLFRFIGKLAPSGLKYVPDNSTPTERQTGVTMGRASLRMEVAPKPGEVLGDGVPEHNFAKISVPRQRQGSFSLQRAE